MITAYSQPYFTAMVSVVAALQAISSQLVWAPIFEISWLTFFSRTWSRQGLLRSLQLHPKMNFCSIYFLFSVESNNTDSVLKLKSVNFSWTKSNTLLLSLKKNGRQPDLENTLAIKEYAGTNKCKNVMFFLWLD